MNVYANTPFDKLEVGMEAEVTRLCVADDLYVFAHASGNLNPLHLPDEDGDLDGRPEAIVPSLWLGALISGVLGNRLPGPGTLYKSQNLRFLGRACAGDTVRARVRLTALGAGREATFETNVEREDGTLLVEGEAVVIAQSARKFFAPTTYRASPSGATPISTRFARAEPLDPIPTAVVWPSRPTQSPARCFARAIP